MTILLIMLLKIVDSPQTPILMFSSLFSALFFSKALSPSELFFFIFNFKIFKIIMNYYVFPYLFMMYSFPEVYKLHKGTHLCPSCPQPYHIIQNTSHHSIGAQGMILVNS